MSSVTDFISKNVVWSILDTGRLKGKLTLNYKEYTILTFEYRADKKQFVLEQVEVKMDSDFLKY